MPSLRETLAVSSRTKHRRSSSRASGKSAWKQSRSYQVSLELFSPDPYFRATRYHRAFAQADQQASLQAAAEEVIRALQQSHATYPGAWVHCSSIAANIGPGFAAANIDHAYSYFCSADALTKARRRLRRGLTGNGPGAVAGIEDFEKQKARRLEEPNRWQPSY